MPQSAAYRSHFALSYSGSKKLSVSPKHFWAWHHNPDREETRDMFLGTLVHLLLLEPWREAVDVVIYDEYRNSKKWDAFKIKNADKLITKTKELNQARGMIAGILENPFIKTALAKPGRAELEFYGTDPLFETPVKCTFDWITDDLVLDLKKTGDTISEFEKRSIDKYNYHVQLMFYLRLAELMDGKKRRGGWIVVEDETPYASQLILPNDRHIAEGNAIVEEMLAKFSICLREKHWPGYDVYMKIAEDPAWKKA